MRLCLCYGYTYVYVYACVPKSVAKAMSLTKTILPMLVKSNTITISIILPLLWLWLHWANDTYPDSKVHGANMGPTWVLSAPDGPYVGPMNLAIGVAAVYREHNHHSYQIIVRSPKNLSASNHNKTQQSMNHVAISSHAPQSIMEHLKPQTLVPATAFIRLGCTSQT